MRHHGRQEQPGWSIAATALLALIVSGAPLDHVVSPSAAAGQQLSHKVIVVNIAVTVRVFKGERFVDDLGLEDFEVYEDGVPQKVEAVYLIHKSSAERAESGPSQKAPVLLPGLKGYLTARHFLWYFEMEEYLPELGRAIDLFFREVLAPGDTLKIVTPGDAWQLKPNAADQVPREVQADQLKTRLRKSLSKSGSRIRNLLATLKSLAADAQFNPEGTNILGARDLVEQIVRFKSMDETGLGQISRLLKTQEGQKHAIIFYHREALMVPAVFSGMFEMAALESRGSIDQNKIRKIFADADTTIHFLYITKTKWSKTDVEFKDPDSSRTVEMSGDFFQNFRNMAIATGGTLESSANPTFMIQKTVTAVENCYLLYYRPAVYRADGKLKDIEVKVKRPGCQVIHRTGYIDK